MKRKEPKPNEQAQEFRHWLLDQKWQAMAYFVDGGHSFEMFARWGRTLMLQTYPGGHGFEVWNPVSTSNEIDATKAAIVQYGEPAKALAEEAGSKYPEVRP